MSESCVVCFSALKTHKNQQSFSKDMLAVDFFECLFFLSKSVKSLFQDCAVYPSYGLDVNRLRDGDLADYAWLANENVMLSIYTVLIRLDNVENLTVGESVTLFKSYDVRAHNIGFDGDMSILYRDDVICLLKVLKFIKLEDGLVVEPDFDTTGRLIGVAA